MPESLARLQAQLADWLAGTTEAEPSRDRVDAETREELKALGYVE